jgi:hypothetical protein
MNLSKTLSLVGLVFTLSGSAAPLLYALPANEVSTYYFTDTNFTHEVGFTFLSCQGDTYQEGKRTPHRVRYKQSCSSSLQEIACYLNGVQTTCPAHICDSSVVECSEP